MELSIILTFTTLFCVMFLFIGIIGSWVIKQYQFERIYGIRNIHPEFFDANGNIVPDEVISVSFNQEYFDSLDDEED